MDRLKAGQAAVETGLAPLEFRMVEADVERRVDHVYTMNVAFETTKLGTRRPHPSLSRGQPVARSQSNRCCPRYRAPSISLPLNGDPNRNSVDRLIAAQINRSISDSRDDRPQVAPTSREPLSRAPTSAAPPEGREPFRPVETWRFLTTRLLIRCLSTRSPWPRTPLNDVGACGLDALDQRSKP